MTSNTVTEPLATERLERVKRVLAGQDAITQTWIKAETPPTTGGPYVVGGYLTSSIIGRYFERTFANCTITLDGAIWKHCDPNKRHVPIEYWQSLGPHPEYVAPWYGI